MSNAANKGAVMTDIEQINAQLTTVEQEDMVSGFANAVREYEGNDLVPGFAAAIREFEAAE